MFKDILIKCVNLIGRDDILNEVKNANNINDITDENIKNDVIKFICYYNFIVCSTFENYLDLTFCERLMSDSKSKIDYYLFSKRPTKVIKVENQDGSMVKFISKTNFILTNKSNETLFVTYKFIPNEISNFNDDTSYLDAKLVRIICFGIVSEFLASKGKFSESEFWNNKFLFELFKIKNNKERRLKSTFCL